MRPRPATTRGGPVAERAAKDIVLTNEDINKIPYAIALGRRSLRIIKQNIALALVVMVALLLSGGAAFGGDTGGQGYAAYQLTI